MWGGGGRESGPPLLLLGGVRAPSFAPNFIWLVGWLVVLGLTAF